MGAIVVGNLLGTFERHFMLQHFFLFAFLLLQPVLCLGLGLWLISLVRRYSPELTVPTTVSFVLGLLVNLWVILGLKNLGAPWVVAAFAPFIPVFIFSEYFWKAIDSLSLKANWDTFLWIVVTSVLGLTLLNGNSGYQTAWPNAYGDYGLHLGMISSFVFGENFPPHYQIFSGAKLSYPFFVNLWSASVWWICPEPISMAYIFFVHWMVVWFVVFAALSRVNRVLPWLIFLGGGTIWTLGQDDGPGISKGNFWPAFLHTIWAPQRSATLGLMVLASIVPFFHDNERRQNRLFQGALVIIGAVIGLAFLAHGHFTIVAALYVGLCLLLRGVVFGWRSWLEVKTALRLVYTAGGLSAAALPLLLIPELGMDALGRGVLGAGIVVFGIGLCLGCFLKLREGTSRSFVGEMLSFCIPLLLAFLSFPLLKDKAAIFSFMSGWFELPVQQGIVGQVATWFKNGCFWLLLYVASWFVTKRHINFAVILVLLVLFNFVQVAVWRWDQIKVFIALFTIILSQLPKLESRSRKVIYAACCIMLLLPSTYQLWVSYRDGRSVGLYSKEDLVRAEQIRSLSAPEDVFLDDGRHLSLATLAGRTVYIGYDGWLWTHGLKYQERVEELKQGRCKDNCPKYVIWDEATAKKWPELADKISATRIPGVFKLKLQ